MVDHTIEVNGIVVNGTKNDVSKVRQALDLLAEKAPTELKFIKKYIKKITISNEPSGVDISEKTFNIKHSTLSISSVEWTASTIAHDAKHSGIFWEKPLTKSTGGKKVTKHITDKERMDSEEVICLGYQLKVGIKVGLDKSTQGYLQDLIKKPDYWDVNKDNKFTYADYKQRNW
ncbi:Uncharacterised protein [Candidatus Gugararchaeum adminiculabundum]|nr:Uncharacterised protein [Candidatus Gugararchaeum adminiculabundum]